MWLVDYMAWDNLMLEVIEPVTHVLFDISLELFETIHMVSIFNFKNFDSATSLLVRM